MASLVAIALAAPQENQQTILSIVYFQKGAGGAGGRGSWRNGVEGGLGKATPLYVGNGQFFRMPPR